MERGEPGRPGGIRGLAALLTEHGEAIEADLTEYYGVDLADVFRGRLSWRRLGVLIRGLPVESRLTATLPHVEADDDDGPVARWTHAEYLMADLYDLLLAVNSSQEQPKPYPRPRRRVVHRRASPERVAQLRQMTGREVPDVR